MWLTASKLSGGEKNSAGSRETGWLLEGVAGIVAPSSMVLLEDDPAARDGVSELLLGSDILRSCARRRAATKVRRERDCANFFCAVAFLTRRPRSIQRQTDRQRSDAWVVW